MHATVFVQEGCDGAVDFLALCRSLGGGLRGVLKKLLQGTIRSRALTTHVDLDGRFEGELRGENLVSEGLTTVVRKCSCSRNLVKHIVGGPEDVASKKFQSAARDASAPHYVERALHISDLAPKLR